MSERLYPYDPAEALETPEAMAVFLSDALEAQDDAHLIRALDVVAQAKARQGDTPAAEAVQAVLAQVSAEAGLSLETLQAVLRPLGMRLAVSAHEEQQGLG
ncbi:transcriptional regulator [Pseudomonas entomophila]|uniref:helix-turn-helix domain-containing transcriptional regulator n=1 Tax=Pseudomonas entomophila TaxID=312306 RepID=UPI0015E27228|nr:transcriptional regulator [Pseudomonas entomophila]MBA1191147.1 transcriptional regulator [Pseudomonas entomophila]